MKRIGFRKITALVLAVLCCMGSFSYRQVQTVTTVGAASTIAELEAEKEENNLRIAEYEAQLAQFDEDQKQTAAYQQTLQDKIDALQSNMQILDTELETIKENLFNLENDIRDMEQTIVQQQEDISKGLEEFKLRLRAMYVSGTDSLASALVGATDFYDLLSKYELISCVARHDDELVNGLKAELESYNQNLATLEAQKAEQERAQAEKEVMQSEMQDAMIELRAAYADSEAEQQRIAAEQAAANRSIEELEEANALADAAEEEIREQIRRAEEEAARRRAEEEAAAEEARRQAEEEAARRAAEEEAARQQATSAPSTPSTPSTPATPSTPSTPAPTQAPTQPPTQPPTQAPTEAPTQPATPSYSDSSFGWPCPGYYYISSGFGTRWGTTHKGIDIAQNQGAAVVASRSGTVIKMYNSCTHNYGKSSNCCGNGYGNYVILQHDDGTYSTLYGHMQSVIVSQGAYVSKGQTIGYVGTTGWSTGYHLHFEIRKNGTAVNPSNYLNY